jgi:hypothetical protein
MRSIRCTAPDHDNERTEPLVSRDVARHAPLTSLSASSTATSWPAFDRRTNPEGVVLDVRCGGSTYRMFLGQR